jgi:hypothetical protein
MSMIRSDAGFGRLFGSIHFPPRILTRPCFLALAAQWRCFNGVRAAVDFRAGAGP